MIRTLKQIQELRKIHAIESLADFLSTQKKTLKEITLYEYQQHLSEGISSLGINNKSEQDRVLVQLVQYDRSFMGDN